MSWTFGIVTFGTSPLLAEAIATIREHGPEGSEVLVVGGDQHPEDADVWVNFDESIKEGWLTRKKNMIAEWANCDNLCVMHDYVGLEPGWASGVESFGNDWLTCMHRVLNNDGSRYRDWCVINNDAWMNPPIDDQKPPFAYPGRLLKYHRTEYGRWQYYSGTYFCVKREVMLETPLDEERVQNQGEDVQWSRFLYQKYGDRAFTMNPSAAVRLLKYKPPVPWQHLEPL